MKDLTPACINNLQTIIDTLNQCIDECHWLDDHIAYKDIIDYINNILEE